MTPRDVIDFWLALPEEAYFVADAGFDDRLREKFGAAHDRAVSGELDQWEDTRDGRLALILLLDQMSRNMLRGTAAMFAADAKALALAAKAIAAGDDRDCEVSVKRWYYMPLMHSEALADQERCVELCGQPGLEKTLPFAITHRDIINQFGRFPHRNAMLGRDTSSEEQAFLDAGGFSG
ncbi:DUF924 family protein [Anderseniella sp. Alg231-50]|uniref:DUF924 family protein n=1 Tax=Anderseniella sp. Alg231-50 TaxID=1922226 RepID=UPI000D55DF07